MECLMFDSGLNASLFFERLPFKPYCVDTFSEGLQVRRKVDAVKRRHIQYNTVAKVSWLCFDVDCVRAHEVWFDANLPVPSLIVQNRKNGHAHLLYALKTPVCRTNAAFLKPLRYLAALEEAVRLKLGADAGFSGLMCKTPHHEAWHTLEADFEAIYELGDLAECVEFPAKTSKRQGISTGLGRNIELFDRLRFWAYKWLGAYKATGDFERWTEVVLSQCEKYNDFAKTLPRSEVKAIAKSVAKWTWQKYKGRMDDKDFAKIQAKRSRKITIEKIEVENGRD
jgi:hypothetical protein